MIIWHFQRITYIHTDPTAAAVCEHQCSLCHDRLTFSENNLHTYRFNCSSSAWAPVFTVPWSLDIFREQPTHIQIQLQQQCMNTSTHCAMITWQFQRTTYTHTDPATAAVCEHQCSLCHDHLTVSENRLHTNRSNYSSSVWTPVFTLPWSLDIFRESRTYIQIQLQQQCVNTSAHCAMITWHFQRITYIIQIQLQQTTLVA